MEFIDCIKTTKGCTLLMQPVYIIRGSRTLLLCLRSYRVGRTADLRVTVILVPYTHQSHGIALLVSELGERLVVAHSYTGSGSQTVNIYGSCLVDKVKITVVAGIEVGDGSGHVIELVAGLGCEELLYSHDQSCIIGAAHLRLTVIRIPLSDKGHVISLLETDFGECLASCIRCHLQSVNIHAVSLVVHQVEVSVSGIRKIGYLTGKPIPLLGFLGCEEILYVRIQNLGSLALNMRDIESGAADLRLTVILIPGSAESNDVTLE